MDFDVRAILKKYQYKNSGYTAFQIVPICQIFQYLTTSFVAEINLYGSLDVT